MKFQYKNITGFLFYILTFLVLTIWIAVGYTVFSIYFIEHQTEEEEVTGIMLMIEFDGMEGLENFSYQLYERDIPSVLLVMPSFAQEHHEKILALQDYGVEIVGVYPIEPFWDIPYDEQYKIMKQTKDDIESLTGKAMRAFGTKYFAYDENTIMAAEELGIEYIFARGTTGAKATIYKPDEYDVKIFSVSNIDSEKWGTGSLCDYSYWAREGTPDDFEEELLDSLQFSKISPVSHTYLGGMKKFWNEKFVRFWDTSDVNWVDLDEFGTVDISLLFDEIPENREVQYTTPKSLIPIEDEQNVDNPCSVLESTESNTEEENYVENKLVMYHNGSGPMCIEAIEFINSIEYEIEEHLTTEEDFYENLESLKSIYETSRGVSTEFGYYPIIFIKDQAFSGFDEEIEQELLEIISS